MSSTHSVIFFVSESQDMVIRGLNYRDKAYGSIRCEVKLSTRASGMACSRKGIIG